jgi:hypothetical protein
MTEGFLYDAEWLVRWSDGLRNDMLSRAARRKSSRISQTFHSPTAVGPLALRAMCFGPPDKAHWARDDAIARTFWSELHHGEHSLEPGSIEVDPNSEGVS